MDPIPGLLYSFKGIKRNHSHAILCSFISSFAFYQVDLSQQPTASVAAVLEANEQSIVNVQFDLIRLAQVPAVEGGH